MQLFGDTVNTASRIETTGERDKIHISKETAEMIQKSGKASWVKPRGEVVTAKVRPLKFLSFDSRPSFLLHESRLTSCLLSRVYCFVSSGKRKSRYFLVVT